MSEQPDIEIEQQADDIAKVLGDALTASFRKAEGRDPTKEEIEEMYNELTEEKVSELMGLTESTTNSSETIESNESAAIEEDETSETEADPGLVTESEHPDDNLTSNSPINQSEIVSEIPSTSIKKRPNEDSEHEEAVKTQKSNLD